MFALKKKFPGNRLSILQHPVWGSCHVTFHSYLTVQSYARLLNILTNQTAALGMYSVFFIPKDLVGSLLTGQLKI
jgi:hypothetical protein